MKPGPFFFEVGFEVDPFSIEVLLLGYLVWDGADWCWLEASTARAQTNRPANQVRFVGMLLKHMACDVSNLQATPQYTFSPPRFVPHQAEGEPVVFLRDVLELGWQPACTKWRERPPGVL